VNEWNVCTSLQISAVETEDAFALVILEHSDWLCTLGYNVSALEFTGRRELHRELLTHELYNKYVTS